MAWKVLIAEDDAIVRRIMTCGLVKEGFNVVESIDGLDALDKVEQVRPDLIVTDVMMPKMDGLALCQKLREDAETEKLPIIIVSASAATTDVRQGYQVGANAYLRKPIKIAKLNETVRSLLSDNGVSTVPRKG